MPRRSRHTSSKPLSCNHGSIEASVMDDMQHDQQPCTILVEADAVPSSAAWQSNVQHTSGLSLAKGSTRKMTSYRTIAYE